MVIFGLILLGSNELTGGSGGVKTYFRNSNNQAVEGDGEVLGTALDGRSMVSWSNIQGRSLELELLWKFVGQQ